MQAAEIMSKYVLTCSTDTTIHELIRLFVRNKVTAIPVVGDDNELLGIISEGDLLYKKVRPHVPQYVNVLGASLYYSGYGQYEETFQKLLATRAEEIMTKEVEYVEPDADSNTVTDMMVEDHLKNVPVVKDKRLVGMISRADILELIARESDLPIV
ncbi:MAG: CBS domain-containing protein [Negativicoccus succinicivorans]|uniref:CBS domain-containing protein n=1 Tax=Negativicoccus succinicivorans TaxID=620903 RepID=UPI0028FEABBA|nr:CBS domain-containing protein [Negativicoccus succinicivorans]MDU1056242.1 CBS domain-containing protein [Negativicoccus succinicivorans]MDU4558812.1 CBS domain-containing protein [Negativicoccus succinicivorans]MDU4576271.1 CBS domain-containing protein [Negativicoccus succinicivorans]